MQAWSFRRIPQPLIHSFINNIWKNINYGVLSIGSYYYLLLH